MGVGTLRVSYCEGMSGRIHRESTASGVAFYVFPIILFLCQVVVITNG